MAQLHRHVRVLTAQLRATAHSESPIVPAVSALAQESLRSLACPLLFQSRSVHRSPPEALQKTYSVHQDAAKERQNTSSCSLSRSGYASSGMTLVNWQPSRLCNTAATNAPSHRTDPRSKKQGTPPKHRGGPQAAVAAKEFWPMQYRQTDRIEVAYSIPRKAVFAVIELGATQYKVLPSCSHPFFL